MRLATFNLENLFRRANALNLQWHEGKLILDHYTEFSRIIAKATYSEADKATLAELIEVYGVADRRSSKDDYFVLQEVRGKLFKYANKTVTIVVDGRAEWDGWLELQVQDVHRAATENTARVIAAVNADVLAVVEVENRIALQRFHTQLLKPLQIDYPHYMVIDGNDERGIDVGIYSRFPIGEIRTHVDDGLPSSRIFSRDCPEYEIRLPSGDSLRVLVNHLKSKGFGNQASNNARRRAQAERVAQIYQEQASGTNIAVVGDFNDTPASDPLAPLLQATDLQDVMSHPTYLGKPNARPGTFKTGAAGGKLDSVLLNPALWNKVVDVDVERRGVFTARTFPHFDEVTSDVTQASDHAAVWVDLDL